MGHELVMDNGVTLATLGGDILTCAPVVITLQRPPMLTARKGRIESGPHRGEFDKIAVPVAQWLGANGSFVPPSLPTAPVEGKHTMRRGVRLLPESRDTPAPAPR
jgi:hypothetical protein